MLSYAKTTEVNAISNITNFVELYEDNRFPGNK